MNAKIRGPHKDSNSILRAPDHGRPPSGWGPVDQKDYARAERTRSLRRWASVVMFIALLDQRTATPALIVLIAVVAVRIFRRARRISGLFLGLIPKRHTGRSDLFAGVLAEAAGRGAYLGVDGRGRRRYAPPERAVLVLGPPRSGKTSAVIIPGLIAHDGPVVSTSTKPDVRTATHPARSRLGRIWVFDPTGTSHVPEDQRLRWSPVACSAAWDGALLMARAMITGAGVGAGTTDQSHWSKRAQALLAPLLHAAATDGREVEAVLGWVARHELDEPGSVLERSGAELAMGALVGLRNTEARERSSIFSAAADALDAYTSQAALDACGPGNFSATEFVASRDTVYIHAPAEHQAAAAPLVCGLLSEIRRATYQAHRDRRLRQPVWFALDEVANIAPLGELPQIASEGGGQGLLLLAALQDLSQARARWGLTADGFLTLFGSKLILPGIADTRTLETISLTLGEYDRPVVSRTRSRVPPTYRLQDSETVSTQRQRVLSPGEIANIPAGRALYLDGVRWELLTLTPAHSCQPWCTLTQSTRAVYVMAPGSEQ
jgi:type IV secretion system protein VirD4